MPLLTETQRTVYFLCQAQLEMQCAHTEYMNEPAPRIAFQRGFHGGYAAAKAEFEAELTKVRAEVQEKLAARKCGTPGLCNWPGCNEVWKTVMKEPNADDSGNA